MKWFLIEDTVAASGPQPHRYVVDADFMVVEGEIVTFYQTPISRSPSRVVRLAPGQIVFEANDAQAAQITEQMARIPAPVAKVTVQ